MIQPIDIRKVQAPLKELYKTNPSRALYVLHAEGEVENNLSFRITGRQKGDVAGPHPATGGDDIRRCSGDMLLESLAACAGVTLASVASAMNIVLEKATIRAEGDIDFRGTLGVSKDVPAGFLSIRLIYSIKSEAPEDRITRLLQITEQYCVVYQTLKNSCPMTVIRT